MKRCVLAVVPVLALAASAGALASGVALKVHPDRAQVFSPASPGGVIEGRLTIGTGTITVTSKRQSLVIAVPAGVALTGFVKGEEVHATFTQLPNGSLSLVKLRGDEDEDDHGGDHDRRHDDGHGGDDDHGHHGGHH
jgi:hypothetical protein